MARIAGKGRVMDHARTQYGTAAGTRSEQRGERTTKTEAEADVRTTSSLSAAQTSNRAEEASLTQRIRSISEVDALTRLVASVRPAWPVLAIRRAIERDDRPWTVVVDSAWRSSNDPGVKHPNGMRFVGGLYETTVPRLPSAAEALAEAEDGNICNHGGIVGRCPLCRGAA